MIPYGSKHGSKKCPCYGSANKTAFTAEFGLMAHSRPLWIHFSVGCADQVFKRFFTPCFSSHPPEPGDFLPLPVISFPSSNMGQKHGSGSFPLPWQDLYPTPRCRDCSIAFRNCKSFLTKNAARWHQPMPPGGNYLISIHLSNAHRIATHPEMLFVHKHCTVCSRD